MKKILCLFFSMLLVFLCACTRNNTTTTTSITTTTVFPGTTDPKDAGELPPEAIVFTSLEEYEDFLKHPQKELSDHFIPYEKLSILGDFGAFICEAENTVYKNPAMPCTEMYEYYFEKRRGDVEPVVVPLLSVGDNDPADQRFHLCRLVISYDAPLSQGEAAAQAVPTGNDLRENTADGYCEISGMWYNYTDGVLRAITWQSGSYWFTLNPTGGGQTPFLEWNLNGNAFFFNFLKADTCLQAKETLMASILGAE